MEYVPFKKKEVPELFLQISVKKEISEKFRLSLKNSGISKIPGFATTYILPSVSQNLYTIYFK